MIKLEDNILYLDKHQELQVYPNNEEIQSHDVISPIRLLGSLLINQDQTVIDSFNMGEKAFGKLKRTDPNKPIIDAYDIDWSGYKVEFNGFTFTPKTTYEMLDLIFRFIKYAMEHGNDGFDEIIWNDNGDNRKTKVLNWMPKLISVDDGNVIAYITLNPDITTNIDWEDHQTETSK